MFRANVTFSFGYVYTGYTSYRIRPRFTHKNGDLGAISVMERRGAAPISSMEHHILDRFCVRLWCSVNGGLEPLRWK